MVQPARGLTKISGIFLARNGFSQAAVDVVILEIYQARESYDNSRTKLLYLHGTNAPPSTSVLGQVATLKSSYKRDIVTSAP